MKGNILSRPEFNAVLYSLNIIISCNIHGIFFVDGYYTMRPSDLLINLLKLTNFGKLVTIYHYSITDQ
jgi:hypothetical protein